MLKRILSFLIALPLYANQPNPEPPELPPDIEVHTNILKQRALEQAMDVLNKPDTCKCLKYAGKKLIACMDYACKKEVRKTFATMSYQARVDYLMHMNLPEYKRFLDAFENEEQWKETLTKLPAPEQKLLPQTVLEQLIIIRDTWLSCAPRRVGIYAGGKKDQQAHDIAAWRNKTLEGYEQMHGASPLLWQWLDERFMEKKINMFHELKKHAAANKGTSA